MKIVFILVLGCLPLMSANQARETRTVENIAHYKDLLRKTKHEVDSLLNRLPDLIVSESIGKDVSRKIKRAAKRIKKAHNSIKVLPLEVGIPDTNVIPDFEIIADTIDIIIPEQIKVKVPFFKRIFKKRKN